MVCAMEENKQSRDTETMILQAAEKEFLEKGYAGTRTTEIARAAGVTHAMLHYYFRTKDKLFEKIVSDKIDKLVDIFLGAVGNPQLPLKERLRDSIERHFDFLVANASLPRFIVNELAVHPERIEQIREKLYVKAGKILSEMQKELDAIKSCIDAKMLLVDIISLNVFPFLAYPMVKVMAGGFFDDIGAFLEMRKQENVRTVLAKLNML